MAIKVNKSHPEILQQAKLTKEQFQYETDDQSKETRYIKLKSLDDLEQLLKVRRAPENGQPVFVSLIKQMVAKFLRSVFSFFMLFFQFLS